MRHWIEADCPEAHGRYDLLPPEQKERISLISGKDGKGQPLRGHRHAYFLLWPDEHGLPTRLIVWRSTPFASDEIEALLTASEYPIAWDDGSSDWRVRLVPLPQNSPVPSELLKASCVWESATPFVPPAERHRFRKNGRERPGESPERILTWLFQKEGKPESQVTLLDDLEESDWVNLHETRNRRFSRDTTRTSWVRPGFRLRVKFESPVSGPLIVGDSCHFGLGLFLPIE